MRRNAPSRKGIMSVWLLVVIALMTAVLALVAKEILKGRELAAGREAELKADWLALGALEYGRSRLEPNAAEGSLDLPEGLSGEARPPWLGVAWATERSCCGRKAERVNRRPPGKAASR